MGKKLPYGGTITDFSTKTCVWCGKEFKGSVRRRTVIWIRKTVRIGGELWGVHGAIMASCNDKVNERTVSILPASYEAKLARGQH